MGKFCVCLTRPGTSLIVQHVFICVYIYSICFYITLSQLYMCFYFIYICLLCAYLSIYHFIMCFNIFLSSLMFLYPYLIDRPYQMVYNKNQCRYFINGSKIAMIITGNNIITNWITIFIMLFFNVSICNFT